MIMILYNSNFILSFVPRENMRILAETFHRYTHYALL